MCVYLYQFLMAQSSEESLLLTSLNHDILRCTGRLSQLAIEAPHDVHVALLDATPHGGVGLFLRYR